MTQPQSSRISWQSSKNKNVGQFPEDLGSQLEAVLPSLRGYTRKVFIGLASVFVSESCPDEAREMLLRWVDDAHRDPEQRHPDDLARRFATAILDNQPGLRHDEETELP